ncbi:Alpha/Beta hydrolase protein [Leucosporidium creatinivorum]|uniref:Alpha/Beta hydrolase protein n=1 Tax=Leucosporidium creatinivorum TaxID=106004 RepID=A0A1Y2C986_9BASI|nr:Alpha/Beta hydrolase protein [Leucosporidium creatinivorum]
MSSALKYPPFAFSLYTRPDGVGTFAYKVLGGEQKATPLVLVHGLSAVGLVDWLPLAEELAHSRPVLIFDHRGIGASTIPKQREKEPYTSLDLADDVVELVKHVGWKEMDLLGFSMGGMIAQQVLVAPRLPFKIRHAVLAATSAKPAHSDLLQAIPSPSSAPQTIEEKIKLVTPFIHVGYDPAFLAEGKNKPTLERRIFESVHTRRPARTVAQQVSVIAGYDVRPLLPTIPSTLPVLLLHGTLDRSVYYTEAKYILRGIKHAKLMSFEGIGHMWYDYYTPSYWAHLLNRFLDAPRGLSEGELSALLPIRRGGKL